MRSELLKVVIVLICYVTAFNFSHRIDHLSFGEVIPGIISPLDGTEKISADCTSVFSNIVYFYLTLLSVLFSLMDF